MNSSILSSAVQAANSSTIPAAIANSTIASTVTETISGMSRNTKLMIGAGIGGTVIIGGSIVGYHMWRKKHPKQAQQPQSQKPSEKPLDESDDFEDEDDAEQDVIIMGGEALTKARTMVITFVTSMVNKGISDKATLMSMSAELVSFAIGAEPGFEFVQEAVEAGLAASKKDDDKK